MEIKSLHYRTNLNNQCGTIPTAALQELIDEFTLNAKFSMGSDVDSSMLIKISSTICEMLRSRFKFIPLKLIAEAYTLGSLGDLGGTTRLTVRNVYIWLSAIEEKYRKIIQEDQSYKDNQRREEEEKAFKLIQKRSSMYGMALYWKISHCPMPDDQYDRLSLDRIVEKVRQGLKLSELTPLMIE